MSIPEMSIPQISNLFYSIALNLGPFVRITEAAGQTPSVAMALPGPTMAAVNAERDGVNELMVVESAKYVGGIVRQGGLAQIDKNKALAGQRADTDIRADNYRLTLTNNPDNRVLVEMSENSEEENYVTMPESMLRNKPYWITGISRPYWKLSSQERDTVVTGVAEQIDGGTEAIPERHREIERIQCTYSPGYFYFLHNDEQVPGQIGASFNTK
ncbi:MAG: hypothetical protein Fur0032_23110 [Terrimicrobiaceae bacterium]